AAMSVGTEVAKETASEPGLLLASPKGLGDSVPCMSTSSLPLRLASSPACRVPSTGPYMSSMSYSPSSSRSPLRSETYRIQPGFVAICVLAKPFANNPAQAPGFVGSAPIRNFLRFVTSTSIKLITPATGRSDPAHVGTVPPFLVLSALPLAYRLYQLGLVVAPVGSKVMSPL